MFQGTIGGNTPQYLVNHFAGKLARGEHGVVLLAGAELLATLFDGAALRRGHLGLGGDAQPEPPTLGQEREGHNATELAHGLYEPINTYPLFENSLRHHLGAEPGTTHGAYCGTVQPHERASPRTTRMRGARSSRVRRRSAPSRKTIATSATPTPAP